MKELENRKLKPVPLDFKNPNIFASMLSKNLMGFKFKEPDKKMKPPLLDLQYIFRFKC